MKGWVWQNRIDVLSKHLLGHSNREIFEKARGENVNYAQI